MLEPAAIVLALALGLAMCFMTLGAAVIVSASISQLGVQHLPCSSVVLRTEEGHRKIIMGGAAGNQAACSP